MPSIRALIVLLVLALPFGACDGAEPHEAAEAALPDTAGLQPLSPTEIEQRAEPMTPEQAEELGVVDTTIQVGEEP